MKIAIKIFLAFRSFYNQSYQNMTRTKVEKDSVDFWHRKMTLNFAVFDLGFWSNQKAKNIFMAVFIVLWSYLLTTKLRCLQNNNTEHTSSGVVHIIYNTLCNWCLMVHNNNHIIQSGVLNKATKVLLGLAFEVLESLVLW